MGRMGVDARFFARIPHPNQDACFAPRARGAADGGDLSVVVAFVDSHACAARARGMLRKQWPRYARFSLRRLSALLQRQTHKSIRCLCNGCALPPETTDDGGEALRRGSLAGRSCCIPLATLRGARPAARDVTHLPWIGRLAVFSSSLTVWRAMEHTRASVDAIAGSLLRPLLRSRRAESNGGASCRAGVWSS